MFTWICPQCGREVPPSAAECPTCAEARAAAARQAAAPPPPPAAQQYPPQQQYAPQPSYAPAPAPPPPPQYQPPPPQYPPPPQQYAPPYPQQQYPQQPPPQPAYVIQEPKKGLPSWLVAVLVTAAIGGGLYGVYKFVGGSGNGPPAQKAALEQVPAAVEGSGIYAKFVEVTGFRLMEDAAKKLKVRFTVVNHSGAPMSGLELRVSLGRAGDEGAPPFAVVDVKAPAIEPYGTAEVEAPVKTNLRVYELPDWQFIKGSFVVTGPK